MLAIRLFYKAESLVGEQFPKLILGVAGMQGGPSHKESTMYDFCCSKGLQSPVRFSLLQTIIVVVSSYVYSIMDKYYVESVSR